MLTNEVLACPLLSMVYDGTMPLCLLVWTNSVLMNPCVVMARDSPANVLPLMLTALNFYITCNHSHFHCYIQMSHVIMSRLYLT